jgi:hypothetical protein
MKILSSRVNWHEDWDNNPTFEMNVDKMLDQDQYLYRTYPIPGHGTLYVSDNTELVKFLLSSGDKSGYGGRKFTLNMEDGSVVEVTGPWSSNSSAVYQITNGEVDCVECNILEENGDFPTLRYHGCCIRPIVAKRICDAEGCHLINNTTARGSTTRNIPSKSSTKLIKPRTRNGVTEMKEY